jgi:hypothetical protein
MAKRKRQTAKRSGYKPARGSSSRLSGNKMLDDLKTVAMIAGGMVAGKYIGDFIDQGTTKISGFLGINGPELQKYVRPVATIGIGLAANQLIKNPIGKKVALGIAGFGVIDGVQKITGNTVLSGLGNIPPSYQALPEFQMPVMGPEDFTEQIIASAQETDPEQVITAGVGSPLGYSGDEMTAGNESDDVMSGFENDDDLTITA